MVLASTWKEDAVERTATAPRYSYTDSANARIIKIYIDNPPTNLGVNRAIVVSSDADKLTYGSVSDNCITYTEASRANTQNGFANAKWQEVDFLCDMANHARAVVGTISKDGLNQVHVQTQSGVLRKVFITYTDNGINPDYSVFYDILQSLQFLWILVITSTQYRQNGITPWGLWAVAQAVGKICPLANLDEGYLGQAPLNVNKIRVPKTRVTSPVL